jgi:predicted O-methyltransferase YrrM
MYPPLQLAIKYCKYYLTASNGKGHGVHSPFVFSFITEVLNDERQFYCYGPIEELRHRLLHNYAALEIEDFGAGSTVFKSNNRTISQIAKSSLKPEKYGKLMFRMADYFQSNIMVELGTSLGITTAYLASGNVRGRVFTFEGARQVAEVAKQNFDTLHVNNIEVIEGNFDDTLPARLDKLDTVDLAFVDGNHRREPTLAYFNLLLAKANDNSVFIFDDIHWSKGMEEAWKEIQQHPSVTLTIDLFFIGLVFFKKEQKVTQHFTVRF